MPAATRQRAGRIINIASVSAMRGGGSLGNTIYGATKASVVALTMGLARELGPLGITVNAVAPAVADTAMTRAGLTDEMRRRIVARIPLGRLATLSDIADLVTFLASDRAAFITGAVIPVDGGILTT
jgi:NAD(P)-dependent dehydrogenase (short-subunit alcohol dehydrogenase family)